MWSSTSPELLGESFFSIAVIMAFGRLFRVLQLHHSLGPLQIALGRMLSEVLTTGLFYCVVIIAFATGILYSLH